MTAGRGPFVEALLEAGIDVWADAVTSLSPVALLDMLRDRNPADVANFMRDMHVPTRRPRSEDAQRVIRRLGHIKPAKQAIIARWLTLAIKPAVHTALHEAVDGDRDFLDEITEDTVRSVILMEIASNTRREHGEHILALAYVAGDVLPERWKQVLTPFEDELHAAVEHDRDDVTDDTDEVQPEQAGFDATGIDAAAGDEAEIDSVFATWIAELAQRAPALTDTAVQAAELVAARNVAMAALAAYHEVERALPSRTDLIAAARLCAAAVPEALQPMHSAAVGRCLAAHTTGALPAWVTSLTVLADTASDPSPSFELLAQLDAEARGDADGDADLLQLIFAAGRGQVQLPAAPDEPQVTSSDDGETQTRAGDETEGDSTAAEVSAPEAVPSDVMADEESTPALEVDARSISEAAAVDKGSEAIAVDESRNETDDELGHGDSALASHDDLSVIAPAPTSGAASPESARPTTAARPKPTGHAGQSEAEVAPEPERGEDDAALEAIIADLELAPDAFAGLFASGWWGLGKHLARALEDEARSRALQAVALCDAIRDSHGPIALTHLPHVLDALTPVALSSDRPMQVLAAAAAIRGGFVAPYSGVASTLELLEGVFGDAPGIAASIAVARDAAISGIDPRDLAPTSNEPEDLAELMRTAREMLEQTSPTPFDRANLVWHDWVGRDGFVSALLAPVRDDERVRAADVAVKVDQLRHRGAVEALLRSADDTHRGPGKSRIEGRARNILLSRAGRAIAVAEEWLAAVEHDEVRTDDRRARQATTLRDKFLAARSDVEALLEQWAADEDNELAGAARGARLLFEPTWAMAAGTPLDGAELDPDLAANRDVLRASVPVTADYEPVDPAAITVALASGAARTWDEAFEQHITICDFVGASAIVDVVRATHNAQADALATRCAEERAAAYGSLVNQVADVRGLLEASRRRGLVDEALAESLGMQLDADEREDRNDIGLALADLATVRTALGDATTDAVTDARARFTRLAETRSDVAAFQERLLRLIDENDLATADELLTVLEANDEPPQPYISEVSVEQFFPAVPTGMPDGITSELIAAARAGNAFGPLDFGAVTEPERVANALETWRQAATGARKIEWRSLLREPLSLCGIEFDSERSVRDVAPSPERRWLDLVRFSRNGEALVPEFGSDIDRLGALRILLAWGRPSDTKLVEWVKANPAHGSVIVLYFGTMSPEMRVRLANRLRQETNGAVLVIDDAVLAWVASLGRGTYDTTVRATLPFAAVAPYKPVGIPPEEMFYGRERERHAVLSGSTHVIYGGRRLGKSALLHAAARRFNGLAHHHAVYLDLHDAAIGATKRADALWDLLATRLTEEDIIPRRTARARVSNKDATTAGVRAWLTDDDRRQLLILLDEVDEFFDVDETLRFSNTAALRALMDATQGRCNVVFAGLHQVQRFVNVPNQPFEHFGKPAPIGPLNPSAAYKLLAKPLRAMGFVPAHEDLVSRALAYCNYTPMLLQEFGRALVERVYRHNMTTELPITITSDDIEQVLSSQDLAARISDRFELTLALDPAYQAIACVIAINAYEEGMDLAQRTVDIRDICRSLWPSCFASIRDDEFRSLLSELVGLGVLVGDDATGWRIRGGNVMRLLGTAARIEQKLAELIERNPVRKSLGRGDVRHILLDKTMAPMSEAQISELVGEGQSQVRVVVGSTASLADRVTDALRERAAQTGRFGVNSVTAPGQLARTLKNGNGMRVVVDSLLGVETDASVEKAEDVMRTTELPPQTIGVIVVRPDQFARVAGLDELPVTDLSRCGPETLRAWAQDVDVPFTDSTTFGRLFDVTGGWPTLAQTAATLAGEHGPSGALQILSETLGSENGAAEFVAETGVDREPLRCVFDLAVELGASSNPSELADVAASMRGLKEDVAHRSVSALIRIGALNDTGSGVAPEPVLARAFGIAAISSE